MDYKLLERVRKGEDVLSEAVPAPTKEDDTATEAKEEAVNEEFERLEEREIAPIAKEKTIKKGEMAPPPAPGAIAGKKRSRNEIIAELKASRQAAADAAKAAAQPSLGPKFRKLGEKKEKSRIERDEKGREVLITVDEDGRVKRKVKRVKVEEDIPTKTGDLLMPDKDAKPLGMEVPEIIAPLVEDEDDGDIFEGAGAEYDPLGGLGDDDDDDSDEEAIPNEHTKQPPTESKSSSSPSQTPSPGTPTSPNIASPPSAQPPPSTTPRNYFTTPSTSTTAQDPELKNPLTDPTILAALKKAFSITLTDPSMTSSDDPEEAARLARRQKLLSSHDRDAEDMDLGFGSSRFGDQEEGEEGGKVKLSVWSGAGKDDDGDGDGVKGKGGKERKRGGKKRKGDKDSAKDVLGVLERRREGGK